MPKVGDYLCPAPNGDVICGKVLPCAEHKVTDPTTSYLLYGSVFQVLPPSEEKTKYEKARETGRNLIRNFHLRR